MIVEASLSAQWNKPVFGDILRDRTACIAISVFTIGQLALTSMHITLWPCPIETFLHIPCPGCGLSRACVLFIQGQWKASLQTHIFAPLLLVTLLLIGLSACLPDSVLLPVVDKISSFEKHTGFSAWLLAALLFYWGLRLAGVVQSV
jgi:hypothetical protein